MRIRQIDAHMMGRHWCQKKKSQPIEQWFWNTKQGVILSNYGSQ